MSDEDKRSEEEKKKDKDFVRFRTDAEQGIPDIKKSAFSKMFGRSEPQASSTTVPKVPAISLTNLNSGFEAAPGTHVVAIAGVLDSKLFSTRNDSKDVLEGAAKMYAGVNGKINDKNIKEMDTPEKWVFRLNDDKQKTLGTHRTLTQVTSDNTVAAKEMYNQIYTLASTSYDSIDTKNYPRLGGNIPKGTNIGNRFQLLFKYTPPNGAASLAAAVELAKADTALAVATAAKEAADNAAKEISKKGAGGAKTPDQEAADTALTNATTARDEASAAFKSISDTADAELKKAQDALAAADNVPTAIAAAEEAVRVATAAADATKINGTGYIRYGNNDTDIKSFSVKNNKIATSDAATTKLLDLLVALIGAGKIEYSAATGGKLSRKKRQMTSKKGGRNNSASRKQNKKGGAKIRRSQKAGKRMR